jgi:release factor glutamine methyltransferase
MTYNQIFHLLKENNIPLADIRDLFEGYFHVDFDRIGIIGEQEGPTKQEIDILLDKLKSGYPVAYLIGYTDILSLHIFLNQDTLIPRIETADFLYSYIKENYDFNHKKILDLCTGSGFIALALKKYYPESIIIGSDISSSALEMAKKNAEYNHLDVAFLKSDFLKDIHEKFDVIISNPPYIEENNPDVDAPYEPRLALFSGADGLDSYRSIFHDLDNHLNNEGIAFFEMESTNVDKTYELAKKTNPDYECEVIQDLYGKRRFLVMKKN